MPDVRLERSVYVPRDWVAHAWCDQELLAEWFCPNPSTSVRAELDVNPNGYWKVYMGEMVVRGEYTEVNLPARLAFTWQWEHEPDVRPTIVQVTFNAAAPASTDVLLEHLDFASETEARAHEEGWNITLDRMAQVVQSHAAGYSWHT